MHQLSLLRPLALTRQVLQPLSRRQHARTSGLGPPMSLDYFMQRGRVLSLYRTIIRATRRIPDTTSRAETRKFARVEFEKHRNVTDISHIRYLLSTGKTECESLGRYIGR